jgi:hypothetical protein
MFTLVPELRQREGIMGNHEIDYWFFSDVEYFSPRIAPPVSILLLLYLKKNNTKNIDDRVFLFRNKPTAK